MEGDDEYAALLKHPSLLAFFAHAQIIGHREDTGYTIRRHVSKLAVHLVRYNALKRHATSVYHDMYTRIRTHRVPV